MNGTNWNQSLGKSEIRHYFIRLTRCNCTVHLLVMLAPSHPAKTIQLLLHSTSMWYHYNSLPEYDKKINYCQVDWFTPTMVWTTIKMITIHCHREYVTSWLLDHAWFSRLLATHWLCIVIILIVVQITVECEPVTRQQ